MIKKENLEVAEFVNEKAATFTITAGLRLRKSITTAAEFLGGAISNEMKAALVERMKREVMEELYGDIRHRAIKAAALVQKLPMLYDTKIHAQHDEAVKAILEIVPRL